MYKVFQQMTLLSLLLVNWILDSQKSFLKNPRIHYICKGVTFLQGGRSDLNVG